MDFLGEVKANVIKLLMFGHLTGIFAVAVALLMIANRNTKSGTESSAFSVVDFILGL